jgi:sigma-E factor negative regulatory protein RseA
VDDRLKESISALMDDEANELELQRVLSHSDGDELSDVWGNYHELRQVMHSDGAPTISIDISASVSQAIRAGDDKEQGGELTESQALDHTEGSITPIGSEAEVEQTVSQSSLAANKTPGVKGWLALAASIAFAFGFMFNAQLSEQTSVLPEVASSDAVFTQGGLTKVSVNSEPKILVEMTEEQARHFGQYLLRHAEHSVRGTQSGFMPLARVASVNSVGI